MLISLHLYRAQIVEVGLGFHRRDTSANGRNFLARGLLNVVMCYFSYYKKKK